MGGLSPTSSWASVRRPLPSAQESGDLRYAAHAGVTTDTCPDLKVSANACKSPLHRTVYAT